MLIRLGQALALTLACAHAYAGTNVLTYHQDALRTGWNHSETILTPANVASSAFGPTGQVALDEQVDAQPLAVSGVSIDGTLHDVIYVATEANTIYAIDSQNGIILGSHNFGAAVPATALPDQCTNNSNYVGIGSTPVIDPATGTLYAITYTYESSKPVFRLHAIDITTLLDRMPSVIIAAHGTLSNGQASDFNPAANRQRAALLQVDGNIYAGFADWCDLNANVSRGWVLGWHATSLRPLASPRLLNRLVTTPATFFNTSVWMSGYGIASDGTSLYFNTGNSDPGGKSHNAATNPDESVLKLSADLTKVEDYFTPLGVLTGWQYLDKTDLELAGAGVLLLPDQPGAIPHLAVTAGKAGPMYLLNRDHLGGLGTAAAVLGAYPAGGCWCGQSYYTGADGIGRVVESTGTHIDVWQVLTTPVPHLVHESRSPALSDLQDPGVFTTISSHALVKDTAIIWAVERVSDANTFYVSLKAFDPQHGAKQIFAGVAGFWPFAPTANANIVPLVANGHVLVASYKTLIAFGLSATPAHRLALHFAAMPEKLPLPAGATHELHGSVMSAGATTLILRLRGGRTVTIDMATAKAGFHVNPPVPGHAADVRGNYAGDTFVATSILRQKDNALLWPADR